MLQFTEQSYDGRCAWNTAKERPTAVPWWRSNEVLPAEIIVVGEFVVYILKYLRCWLQLSLVALEEFISLFMWTLIKIKQEIFTSTGKRELIPEDANL